jgi:hypothetical protein
MTEDNAVEGEDVVEVEAGGESIADRINDLMRPVHRHRQGWRPDPDGKGGYCLHGQPGFDKNGNEIWPRGNPDAECWQFTRRGGVATEIMRLRHELERRGRTRLQVAEDEEQQRRAEESQRRAEEAARVLEVEEQAARELEVRQAETEQRMLANIAEREARAEAARKPVKPKSFRR